MVVKSKTTSQLTSSSALNAFNSARLSCVPSANNDVDKRREEKKTCLHRMKMLQDLFEPGFFHDEGKKQTADNDLQ